MQRTTVQLSQLTVDKINVRKAGRGADALFVASIEARGIIEPLTVRANGAGYKVINGGKRLASLQLMLKEKRQAAGVLVDKAFPVPVTIREDDDQAARDISLITNIVRADMHPIDRFEAFVDLRDAGMTPAAIAAQYAMKTKEVDQVLALGALAPVVREAWRRDEINAEAAETFTLLPDHEEQAQIFAKLKKRGGLHEWSIRREIGGDDRETVNLVRFVGEKAYVDAGGKILKDLFGDKDAISDPKLAKKLAEEKLQAKIGALLKDGWSWVKRDADVPNRWSLGRIEKKKGAYTAADKAKSGVIVGFNYTGTFAVDYGFLSPAESRRKKATNSQKQRAAKGLPEDTMPKALSHRLSLALTTAASAALASGDPSIALAAIIASLSPGVYETPVRLKNDSRLFRQGTQPTSVDEADEDLGDDDVDMAFEDAFAAALKLPDDVKLREVGTIVSRALDFQRFDGGSSLHDDKGVAALCNALDPIAMRQSLQATFDAKDYFAGANGAVRVKAVAEAVNADEAAKVAKMKKPEAVAYCIANVPPTGWLPPELRTAHYDGPGAIAAKKPGKTKKGKTRKADGGRDAHPR